MEGELKNEIAELRNKVDSMEEILTTHKHKGFDETLKLGLIFPIEEHLQGAIPVTAANYGIFFVNKSDRTYEVSEIQVSWGTASTSGTLQIERLQSTEAKGAGDDLLSSTIDMSGTANTVNTGTLVTDKTLLKLEKGNRLGLVNGGTLTSQTDLCVTVYLQQN